MLAFVSLLDEFSGAPLACGWGSRPNHLYVQLQLSEASTTVPSAQITIQRLRVSPVLVRGDAGSSFIRQVALAPKPSLNFGKGRKGKEAILLVLLCNSL